MQSFPESEVTACFYHERVLESISYFCIFIGIPSENKKPEYITGWTELSFLVTGSHTVIQVGLELSV